MTATLSPATFFGANVAGLRVESSPTTYVAPLPVPRTPGECEHLLEVTKRRMRAPEARSFFAKELARFLGAGSAVWSPDRRAALHALLASAGESGVDAVLDAVARTSRAEVSDEAEVVLKEMITKSPTLVPALTKRFEGVNAAARASIVRSLAETVPRSVRTLIVEALDDADVEVRDAAAVALGRVGGPSAKSALIRRLARERSAVVRESIQDAIDELGAV